MKLIQTPVYFDESGALTPVSSQEGALLEQKYGKKAVENAKKGSIASRILAAHNIGSETQLQIKFDALASHDITYVGIIQTARASGLTEFPLPYVLTNCHNSLCAVGGTINEDDHLFGLSAAQKYGGVYVPAHIAVIHQYMRECMSRCGSMILVRIATPATVL
jgi:aconitate hydratase